MFLFTDLNSLLGDSADENSNVMIRHHQYNINKRKLSFDQQTDAVYDDNFKRLNTVPIGAISSQPNAMSSTTSNFNSQSISSNLQQQRSTGPSHQLLACQNPMLASMLAKTPTSLPEEKIQTIPPSMISSTPDVKLPPNLDKKILPTPNFNQQQEQQRHQMVKNFQQPSHSNISANSMPLQNQQQIQSIPNIQLQLQQSHQIQSQQNLITSAVGLSGVVTTNTVTSGPPTHVAVKSVQINPNQMQTLAVKSQMSQVK